MWIHEYLFEPSTAGSDYIYYTISICQVYANVHIIVIGASCTHPETFFGSHQTIPRGVWEILPLSQRTLQPFGSSLPGTRRFACEGLRMLSPYPPFRPSEVWVFSPLTLNWDQNWGGLTDFSNGSNSTFCWPMFTVHGWADSELDIRMTIWYPANAVDLQLTTRKKILIL